MTIIMWWSRKNVMRENNRENDIMNGPTKTDGPAPEAGVEVLVKLLKQYGCGPVQFIGSDGLYERHLIFDNVEDPAATSPREHFEAAARSIRDVLSQRCVATEKTCERENPKRIYYLSMEFLIGRSLANNITNLLLDPLMKQTAAKKSIDWLEVLQQEPDAGLGNGGLGLLAACFLDSRATMELRPWVTACVTNTASSNRRSRTAGRSSTRTTGS